MILCHPSQGIRVCLCLDLEFLVGLTLWQAAILKPRKEMLMTPSSNAGPKSEKAQPSMVLACSEVHLWPWNTPKPLENTVFSWLPCTTLENQAHFYAKKGLVVESGAVLYNTLWVDFGWHIVQLLVRILKKRNPPWFWCLPKSMFGLGTRQNHRKTKCLRALPAPRSTASPICMRKWTGCREWCCFVYYFMGWFWMTLCSTVGPNFEKAQPSMVLACSQV